MYAHHVNTRSVHASTAYSRNPWDGRNARASQSPIC